MAETLLTASEAARVLGEIDRLYQQLKALPACHSPLSPLGPSGAYLALETEIRIRADRYRAWEDQQPEKCRMAKAGLRPWTTADEDEDSNSRR